jgi:hypothetical protein
MTGTIRETYKGKDNLSYIGIQYKKGETEKI